MEISSRVMISEVVDDGKSESTHVGVSFSLSLLAGGGSCSAEVLGEIYILLQTIYCCYRLEIELLHFFLHHQHSTIARVKSAAVHYWGHVACVLHDAYTLPLHCQRIFFEKQPLLSSWHPTCFSQLLKVLLCMYCFLMMPTASYTICSISMASRNTAVDHNHLQILVLQH